MKKCIVELKGIRHSVVYKIATVDAPQDITTEQATEAILRNIREGTDLFWIYYEEEDGWIEADGDLEGVRSYLQVDEESQLCKTHIEQVMPTNLEIKETPEGLALSLKRFRNPPSDVPDRLGR